MPPGRPTCAGPSRASRRVPRASREHRLSPSHLVAAASSTPGKLGPRLLIDGEDDGPARRGSPRPQVTNLLEPAPGVLEVLLGPLRPIVCRIEPVIDLLHLHLGDLLEGGRHGGNLECLGERDDVLLTLVELFTPED